MSETRKFAATVGCVGHSRRYQLGGCNREYVGGWLKRDGVPLGQRIAHDIFHAAEQVSLSAP